MRLRDSARGFLWVAQLMQRDSADLNAHQKFRCTMNMRRVSRVLVVRRISQ
jgi:hypothetical protein